MRKPNRCQILGSHLRRARNRPNWNLRRSVWPSVGESQCVLQRGCWRKIRPQSRSRWLRARHHGLSQSRAFRKPLQTRQLHLRTIRSRKQLGQGTLHRGSWVDWPGLGRSQKRSRRMRLLIRIPDLPLSWRRNRIRNGNPFDHQDQRRVPR